MNKSLPDLGFYALGRHLKDIAPSVCRWCDHAMVVSKAGVVCPVCDLGPQLPDPVKP
jgi:hypothetical protein